MHTKKVDFNEYSYYFKEEYSVEKLHLIFLRKGVLTVSLKNQKKFLIAPAILCLNEYESGILQNCHEVEMLKLSFSPNIINSKFTLKNIREGTMDFSETDKLDCIWLHPFIQRTDSFFGQIKFGFKLANRISNLFNRAKDILNDQLETNKDYIYRANLLELLIIIRNLYSNSGMFIDINENAAESCFKLEDVVAYLNLNYSEKISIPEITKKFNTNRTTLAKEFKKMFGISPITYLNKVRVNHAISLLLGSNLSVYNIMYKVGFNNYNYFSMVFKRQIGCSPNDFRKKNCKTEIIM